VDVSQDSQLKSDEDENVTLHAKKRSGVGGSNDMGKVR